MAAITIREAAEFFRSHDHYLILTHRRPDGDTVGCAAALCLGLRMLGKCADVYDNPQFTKRFAPYLNGLCRKDLSKDDTVISTDIASPQLLPFGAEAFCIELSVDHHGSNNLPAKRSLIEGEKAACGEIIFALLLELGIQPSKEMAELLYIAISTDTGCFKYSNTTANTLHTAAALKECGAQTAPINKLFFDTKSFSRLQLEARLTGSVEFYANGLVGLCAIPEAWIEELHISEDDIDSISGFARSIEGVEIGIMIREVEGGKGKISLRTGPQYDASALCSKLGGGGHRAAAGASVDGGIENAKKAILQVLLQNGIQL